MVERSTRPEMIAVTKSLGPNSPRCFGGKIIDGPRGPYDRYGFGPEADCNDPLGGQKTFMVYVRKTPPAKQPWTDRGCFGDASHNRAVPFNLGRFFNPSD